MVGPQELARSAPGALLHGALQQMAVYDSCHAGPESGLVHGSFRRYLQTILFARHSERDMGMRNARELRTLAKALDAITAGNIALAADTLTQRWKAVETSIADGGWNLARHLELLPAHDVGLTLDGERAVIARAELERSRLEEVGRKAAERNASRATPAPSGGGRGG